MNLYQLPETEKFLLHPVIAGLVLAAIGWNGDSVDEVAAEMLEVATEETGVFNTDRGVVRIDFVNVSYRYREDIDRITRTVELHLVAGKAARPAVLQRVDTVHRKYVPAECVGKEYKLQLA